MRTYPKRPTITRAKFKATHEWLEETLALAERYGQNRGVFFSKGEFYEETVRPGNTREWVWTSAEYLARQRGLSVLPKAA